MNEAKKPLLPVIAGATATGKTAIAVELAKRIGGEIIGADSMQVYRGMEILSAAPTPEEMGGVPHHMIGVYPPTQKLTAAFYRDEATRIIADVARRGRIPILCGGTGLYIDALTRPMRFAEKSDEALHAALLAQADEPGGKQRLHRRLEQIDPDSARRLHENDVRRVVRAIEVYELTGTTLTEQNRIDAAREGDCRARIFAPEWDREVLYERISARVDEMVRAGLVDEVQRLLRAGDDCPTAWQAIGFKEIAAALQGRCTMDEAIFEVKHVSRVYAKRQMTWLRRDGRVTFLPARGKSPAELAETVYTLLSPEL